MKNDWFITISVSVLCAAGLATLLAFGADNWFIANQKFLRQLLYILIGILLLRTISTKDPKYLSHSGFLAVMYVASLVLLGLVLVAGRQINGARSWFDFGIVSLQPADFVKIVFILILAKYLSKRHVALAHIKHFFISGIYWLLPVGLIMLQPDLGTALVFAAVWIVLLLVAGLSRKFILIIFMSAVVLGTVSWVTVLEPYQKDRIKSFVAPLSDITGSGYNAYQSVVAVGSGGVLGKGLGFGTQSRLEYLPEHHTDFIFASFTEEWGFVGSLLLITALLVFCLRLLWYARHATSNFETLFIIGYTTVIFVHSTIHIGMNIGLLPVTGLPLPFTSFGGSHIVVEFIGLGIVMAMVSRYSSTTLRGSYAQDFTTLTEM